MQPLSSSGFDRRDWLKLAGLSAMSWLTPVGHLLAQQAEKAGKKEPAQSVILLWMAGGPSQLETFDPHPGTEIAAGTRAINTGAKGIQLAEGFDLLAEHMGSVSLVRSLVSKEGDHERGTYLMKTGYRPDPTIVHPSIGAICCHELPVGKTEIPRHVSILPGQWPSRGGFLGDQFDAFKTYDPSGKVPDVTARVPPGRDQQRVADLDIVERAFQKGRRDQLEGLLHQETVKNARVMMTSEQLKAFEVIHEPAAVRKMYGDTAFGRGCLAARRLIEVGVRCVEVTLNGWDSHADNHKIQRNQIAELVPAFSALLRELKERKLLERTIVICAGEFGRTPMLNRLGGRDHWPKGYSLAIAGGGLRGGTVIGSTDPKGKADPTDPVEVADVHATVLTALDIKIEKVLASRIGRTFKLSEGTPIAALKG